MIESIKKNYWIRLNENHLSRAQSDSINYFQKVDQPELAFVRFDPDWKYGLVLLKIIDIILLSMIDLTNLIKKHLSNRFISPGLIGASHVKDRLNWLNNPSLDWSTFQK